MTIDCCQLEDLPSTNEVTQSELPSVVYNQVDPFLKEGTREYRIRLNGSPDHTPLIRIPGLKKDGKLGVVSAARTVRVRRENVKFYRTKLQRRTIQITKVDDELDWAGNFKDVSSL